MELGPHIRFYLVDAFTDRAFHGSTAAVFLPDEPLNPRAMQLMAREMNLSETAFVQNGGDAWEIRWFTPTVEVSVCGHALAADALEIDLPPSGLLRALGCHEAVPVLRSSQIWVVRLSWQKEVEALTPNVSTLLEVDIGDDMLGVAVTAPGMEGADFVSRFFAPWVGVPEDPVTGLAHTALAPYWARLLERTRLQARQLSAREGDVGVEVEGDQVVLFGRAITIAQGTMGTPLLATPGTADDDQRGGD